MPNWWMAGESVIVGLLIALLVGGLCAGVRRGWRGKKRAWSKEADLNTRSDVPRGLDSGVTPQSIGGASF